jgi:hypothetical protein
LVEPASVPVAREAGVERMVAVRPAEFAAAVAWRWASSADGDIGSGMVGGGGGVGAALENICDIGHLLIE